MKYAPVVLAILDGWGCRDESHGNAVAAARLPHWRALFEHYPWTMLQASGQPVGLPDGIMGNSEVGHLNMGAGRIVPQGVSIIDDAIAAGKLARDKTLQQCIAHVRRSGGRLHLLGLLSDGCVHSSLEHVLALVDAIHQARVPIAIDVFLDGRDTPPESAEIYIDRLEERLSSIGCGDAIASVIGRYYAMDRDKRWERTQLAYDALARSDALFHAPNAQAALRAAYARGETDEFVAPTIVGEPRPIDDGDACIFFNFRPDRARQLTTAFNAGTTAYAHQDFDAFSVKQYANLVFATMVRYEEHFNNPVLFGPRPQLDTFGDAISRAGLHQLRLAETEKYAHVTYFFNGGREDILKGEDRKLIPSDRSVPTYDLAPAMRAREITDYAVEQIAAHAYDVIVLNYANADMVGHTGKWEPTIAALELLDACIERLVTATLHAGGLLAITADHGNAEDKIDAGGKPLTAHTTNPVPFVLVANGLHGSLARGGKLGDIAPTLLPLMHLPVPEAMTGHNLFAPQHASVRS